MTSLLWNARMYLRLLSVQLRSQMQFRFSFWMDLLSTIILNGSFVLSLALILQRFGGIAGWTFGEVAFLVGMVEMSFGAMDMVFSGFDDTFFSTLVRLGSFDQLLLRPVGITWQVLGSRFLLRRIGRIIEGFIIFVISLSLIQIHWTLAKVLYLPVVLVCQLLTMGSLFMAGSTITFWTMQSIEAMNVFTYGGTEMMSYPMTVYPGWMQRFFTYAIPFIFMNYYPALFFLDKPDPLGFPPFAPFLAPLVAVVFFFLALRFWRFGIDHYQSSGS
jgi:ABC-2 type transport system permease protein